MLTAITPFAKDYHFLPVKLMVMLKYNVIMFQILNENKVKLCCPRYLLYIFNLKRYTMLLRGRNNFPIIKFSQNRNTMVASMVNFWNNLGRSLRYQLHLLKPRKLLETNCRANEVAWEGHILTFEYNCYGARYRWVYACVQRRLDRYRLNL